ncbi:MAG: TM0106 family RecB-like putative nuclease [Nitrospira sp.]|nr:TM0106 family RecB-like putative nuclease [Nitrospira sp.]
MELNNEIIDDFLFCKYRAYLKLIGQRGVRSDYELVEEELYVQYKKQFLEDIESYYKSEQIINPVSSLDKRSRLSPSLLINPHVKGDNFLISFDALRIVSHANARKKMQSIPLMITPKEKVTKNEKISLTIKTILLNSVIPKFSETGKIVFGKKLLTSLVRIKDYRKIAQKMLDDLTALSMENGKPSIVRCDNCRMCEFEKSCRKYLVERDDLSLMGSLSAAEILKRNKKGVFTINQLSYGFRPKRFKRARITGRPFSPELKALAIRDKKTYILDIPFEIKSGMIEIFLDFEGLPDENFVYLIGLIIKDKNSERGVCFWANSQTNERAIFQKFVKTISGYKDFVIYHYGSYEIRELRRAVCFR